MEPTLIKKQTREPIHISRCFNDVCRNCKGTGIREERTCPVCNGHGLVRVTKEIDIYVEPIK